MPEKISDIWLLPYLIWKMPSRKYTTTYPLVPGSTLSYHLIPSEISGLIRNIYEDYTVSIGTKEFLTSPMKVGKGVIQGDCLSPLLFNMCINSLIKCIEDERTRALGYHYCNTLKPRHWFQFANLSCYSDRGRKSNDVEYFFKMVQLVRVTN